MTNGEEEQAKLLLVKWDKSRAREIEAKDKQTAEHDEQRLIGSAMSEFLRETLYPKRQRRRRARATTPKPAESTSAASVRQ